MARLVSALVLIALTGAMSVGCNSSKKSHAQRTSSTTAGLSSTTVATTGTGASTTGAPAGNNTAPAGNNTAPTTGVGSRFWYEGDAFGGAFKAHSSSEASFVQQVLTLINRERAAVGANPLAADPQAERAAKAHVEDMAGRSYFDHISPEGWTPEDRLRMTGATGYTLTGENIAVGQRTAQDVMNAWMNSAGHRANILDPRFTHVGIGLDEASFHWAQVFLRR